MHAMVKSPYITALYKDPLHSLCNPLIKSFDHGSYQAHAGGAVSPEPRRPRRSSPALAWLRMARARVLREGSYSEGQ